MDYIHYSPVSTVTWRGCGIGLIQAFTGPLNAVFMRLNGRRMMTFEVWGLEIK